MRTDLALLLVTISVNVVVTSGQVASKCDPNICRLPSCYCGGTDVPGGLSRYERLSVSLMETEIQVSCCVFPSRSHFGLQSHLLS